MVSCGSKSRGVAGKSSFADECAFAPAAAIFYSSAIALMSPSALVLDQLLPQRVVMCFSRGHRRPGGHPPAHNRFSLELGGADISVRTHPRVSLAVFHPGVGASIAVLHMEKAIAAGAQTFVACGGAGAVEPGWRWVMSSSPPPPWVMRARRSLRPALPTDPR